MSSTAAVVGAAFAALYAGHQVGDHIVQSNSAAAGKGAPTEDLVARGVHPWTGWGACLRHVSTYTLTQAVALILISVAAPLGSAGAVAALTVSASTHAVIDRRWIVRKLIRAKGCQDWREAPYVLDQSLHIGVLLIAAVAAAVVTTVGIAAAVVAVAIALVSVALVAERRHADEYKKVTYEKMSS